MTKREIYLDVVKGIGIILVVWAHVGGPGSEYIYHFHMPLFFLISGYLYNENTPLKDFVVKRVKSLYFPFVGWNIAFTVFKMMTSSLGLVKGLIKIAAILLTITKDGTYLGATWFLGALFCVSVLYKGIDQVLQKYVVKNRYLWLLCVFTGISIVGFAITLPMSFSRTFVLSMFYALGHAVRRYQEQMKKYDNCVSFLLALVVCVLIGSVNTVKMGDNVYTYKLGFIIEASLATYVICFFSRKICQLAEKYMLMRATRNLVSFLGERSIDIVIWQFVFIKLVIAVQLFFEQKPLELMNEYRATGNGYWWIVYMVLSIFMSVVWCDILAMEPWGHLLKKLHLVNR